MLNSEASLTGGHSPAGGLYEWPLQALPNRTEPWIHQTDPRIGLAETSGRRLASTPSPEDTFVMIRFNVCTQDVVTLKL